VAKYRHLLDEALTLSPSELALLAVLMLRGPQTPGELKQRTERLYPFPSLPDVEDALERLAERELVTRLPRSPGQKETRFVQLLGDASEHPAERPVEPAAAGEIADLEDRLRHVEVTLASLVARVDALDR
jgi:uncharacterized protein YceH (UPF0502 family)